MIKTIFKPKTKSNLSNQYPQTRDLKRNPRCYDYTDTEREEAARRVDQVLRERAVEHSHGYYGA
jgi:hypothetical protein